MNDQSAEVARTIERLHFLSARLFELRARQHQLSIPQFVILKSIVALGPDISMIEISRASYVPPSTITGIANQLERKGLIERERPPDDRRTVLVRATEQGTQLIDAIEVELSGDLDAVLEQMHPDRVEQFVQLFSEVLESYQELVERTD